MDKELIRKRFAAALKTYSTQAVVQKQVAEHLSTLMKPFLPNSSKPMRGVEIGCGTGLFTRKYLSLFDFEHLWLNDLCPEVQFYIRDLLCEKISFLPGDAEQIDYPTSLDLILSCSVMQWFTTPEKFFLRSGKALKQNRLLVLSTFGKETLREITSLIGRGLSYPSLEELKAMLIPQYKLLTAEESLIILKLDSPMDVLRQLKATGVTGVRHFQWTRKTMKDFTLSYKELYSTLEGQVTLTYHPIYLIAQKK